MSKKPLGKPQKSMLADLLRQIAGTENDQTCASTATQEAVKAEKMNTLIHWHRRIILSSEG
jgi:hypothetical protein